jgi:hypothetical protein
VLVLLQEESKKALLAAEAKQRELQALLKAVVVQPKVLSVRALRPALGS